jgi:hypothetical protein
MRVVLALLVLAAAAGDLPGQRLHAAFGGSAVAARVKSEQPAATVALSGAVFGAQGTLSVGRLLLHVAYLQGTLNPDSGIGSSRDFIEGRALLGFRALPWLTVQTGPHARAYVIGGTTQRWLLWIVGARAEGAFIGSAGRGYAEVWRAVSGDASVPERFGHAQGGEVGMLARLTRLPLEVRFAYRIDRAVLGGGSRLETVDGVVVAVSLPRR